MTMVEIQWNWNFCEEICDYYFDLFVVPLNLIYPYIMILSLFMLSFVPQTLL